MFSTADTHLAHEPVNMGRMEVDAKHVAIRAEKGLDWQCRRIRKQTTKQLCVERSRVKTEAYNPCAECSRAARWGREMPVIGTCAICGEVGVRLYAGSKCNACKSGLQAKYPEALPADVAILPERQTAGELIEDLETAHDQAMYPEIIPGDLAWWQPPKSYFITCNSKYITLRKDIVEHCAGPEFKRVMVGYSRKYNQLFLRLLKDESPHGAISMTYRQTVKQREVVMGNKWKDLGLAFPEKRRLEVQFVGQDTLKVQL